MPIMNPCSQSQEIKLAHTRGNLQLKQEGTCWVDLLGLLQTEVVPDELAALISRLV